MFGVADVHHAGIDLRRKKTRWDQLDPTRYRFQCNNLPLLDVLAKLRYLVEEIANGPNIGLWYKCGSKVPPVLCVPTDAV